MKMIIIINTLGSPNFRKALFQHTQSNCRKKRKKEILMIARKRIAKNRIFVRNQWRRKTKNRITFEYIVFIFRIFIFSKRIFFSNKKQTVEEKTKKKMKVYRFKAILPFSF